MCIRDRCHAKAKQCQLDRAKAEKLEPYEGLTKEETVHYAMLFYTMDINRSNAVDRDEAKKYLVQTSAKLLGNPPPEDVYHQRLEKEVNEMFASMDQNHDQEISLEEFLACHAAAKAIKADKEATQE
eukprot:TRINITY_DN36285_c0_g1_i1.p1 TRINITY_DN36285_c0_g1~~TRINITY_DN36285_c0_g1_i1.p1  ORF type:complete len:127 (+),score=57.87 TRINITY_DN36285_c0_g1_i1:141-521(+)